jgi:hypothetical protein
VLVLTAQSPDGIHMELDSGYPEFDAAAGVLAPTAYEVDGKRITHLVHPVSDCSDSRWALPGQRQAWDFDQLHNLPANIADYITAASEDGPVAVNEIRHYSKKGWVRRHGYVLSRDESQGYELLKKFYCGPDERSIGVVDICALYLTEAPYVEVRVSRRPRARLSALAA